MKLVRMTDTLEGGKRVQTIDRFQKLFQIAWDLVHNDDTGAAVHGCI